MAVIVQPSTNLVFVPDSALSAYTAAGWVQATAAQIVAWNAADPYGGSQGYPEAPPLDTPTIAPPPIQADQPA